MLTEMGRDWVHDSQNCLKVCSNYKLILLTAFGNQVAFLDGQQMVEDYNDRSMLHLGVSFVGLCQSLADLVHHQFVPKRVC